MLVCYAQNTDVKDCINTADIKNGYKYLFNRVRMVLDSSQPAWDVGLKK